MNILEKYKKSIGISFLLTIIAIPIAFFEIRLLNSVSPEAVGYLAIVEMIFLFFVSVMSGNASLTFSKFFTSWTSQEKKMIVIYKFLFVNLLYTLVLIIIYSFFLDNLSQLDFTINYSLFIVLGEMLIIYSFLNGIVSGSLDLKASVISNKSYPIIRFLFILFIFMLFSVEFSFNLILLAVTLTLVIINTYLIIRITKLKIFERGNKNKVIVPKVFIFFSIISILRAIILFLYEKLDQIMLLKYVDVETLSLYFALLKIAIIIKMIPKIINTSSIPVFSSLIEDKEYDKLNDTISKNISFNFYVGLISTIGIIIIYPILFEFLGIPKDGLLILVIIMFTFQISVTSIIYDSILNSMGKASNLLWNSVVTILVQFILIMLLIEQWGIVGVSIAKLVSGVCGQYYLYYSVSKTKEININEFKRISMLVILVIYLIGVLLLSSYVLICIVSIIFLLIIIKKIRSEKK